MTSLTINGSAAAASTLAAAGKLFNATGGTSGNTSTKVGTSTGHKQLFAKGTSTNQTGAGSRPVPSDSNFSGWMWDVTTLEGQRLAAGTYTPTIHLLASTGTTVTPTAEWFKRSSGGVYTSIGTVSGSSIALTTSSQALTFTPPSLSLMDFATGDKLVMWLWVNQTAGGAANSTISVVEATSASSSGVASEAQTVTPGYAPTPVSLPSVTLAGVGTITAPLSRKVVLSTTAHGVGTLTGAAASLKTNLTSTCSGKGTFLAGQTRAAVPRVMGSTLYPLAGPTLSTALTSALHGAGTLSTTCSASFHFSAQMSGVGTLTGTLSTSSSGVALTETIAGAGTLSATLSAKVASSSTIAGVGVLTSTLSVKVALAKTIAGVGTLSGAISTHVALSSTITGVGTLSGVLHCTTALSKTLVGTGTLTGTGSYKAALYGTLPGAGTLSGTLSGGGVLTSRISGVGTLTGAATLSAHLSSVSIQGVGVLSPTLTARMALTTTTIRGVGTAESAAVALSTKLTRTLVGIGSLSAAYALSTHLTSLAHGTGQLSGTPEYHTAVFCTLNGGGSLETTLRSGVKDLVSISYVRFRIGKHRTITCLLRSESPHLRQSLRYEQPHLSEKLRSEQVHTRQTLRDEHPHINEKLRSELQHMLAQFAESTTMSNPNTTVDVAVTITDMNNVVVSNLPSASCVVTFPDGSTSTYTATNQGSGVYVITYTTKGPGLHRELWSFTDLSGATAQYMNVNAVSF